MERKIFTLFSRTPVHVGAGNSIGVVDLPIMRERHTQIPIIPGSSLKGVLRDLIRDRDQGIVEDLFGSTPKQSDPNKQKGSENNQNNNQERAGNLLIGEARVLAFPVRSARGCFAWITSPLALTRYYRDIGEEPPKLPPFSKAEQCIAVNSLVLNNQVILEEYILELVNTKEDLLTNVIEKLKVCSDDPVWSKLGEHFTIVSDEMFSYFCANACEITTRIAIDDETRVVKQGALFNQENIPSETLFYGVIHCSEKSEKDKENFKKFVKILEEIKMIQVGGDETIGLGYCSIKLY